MATTKRRMTWRTGIPFILACALVGFLVGWVINHVIV